MLRSVFEKKKKTRFCLILALILDHSIDFEYTLIYQTVEINFFHYEIQLLNSSCHLS